MPGHRFRVEPIIEGGIEFVDWPGKKSSKEFKTIRFHSSSGFPPITSKTPDDTNFHLNSLRFREGKCVYFFVKAFYGAPVFTKKEMNIFKDVFTQVVPLGDDWTLYKPRVS